METGNAPGLGRGCSGHSDCLGLLQRCFSAFWQALGSARPVSTAERMPELMSFPFLPHLAASLFDSTHCAFGPEAQLDTGLTWKCTVRAAFLANKAPTTNAGEPDHVPGPTRPPSRTGTGW